MGNGGLSVATFEMGDGLHMPQIGFGTFQIKEEEAEAPVLAALKVGYRHIDTAELYKNASGIGRALAASGVPRSEVFVTTKVSMSNSFDATVQFVTEAVAKLGVEYVDLVLVHTPFGGKDVRLAKYKGLVECQRRGLTKSIGVSNFEIAHLEELAAEGLPTPAANQLELHPLCQKTSLLAYMVSKKILPIAYSSLAPLSSWRDGYTAFTGSKQQELREVVQSPICAIAAKVADGNGGMGVPESKLLLKYALQKGWAILPKSVREERIQANFDLSNFTIASPEMAELDALDEDKAFAFGEAGNPVDPSKAP